MRPQICYSGDFILCVDYKMDRTPQYSIPKLPLLFPILVSYFLFMSSMSTLNLKIEFGGGIELLFGKIRSHKITIPVIAPATASGSKTERPADVTFLIQWLRDNLLKERSELFVDGNGEGVYVRYFV